MASQQSKLVSQCLYGACLFCRVLLMPLAALHQCSNLWCRSMEGWVSQPLVSLLCLAWQKDKFLWGGRHGIGGAELAAITTS